MEVLAHCSSLERNKALLSEDSVERGVALAARTQLPRNVEGLGFASDRAGLVNLRARAHSLRLPLRSGSARCGSRPLGSDGSSRRTGVAGNRLRTCSFYK